MVRKKKLSAEVKRKLVTKAIDYSAKGKYIKAVKIYEDIIIKGSKDAKIFTKYADVLLRCGKAGESMKALVMSAELYVKDGFYSKAIAVYTRVLCDGNSSEDISILMNIADLRFKTGMIRDGIEMCKKVINLLPHGDVDGKIKTIEKIIEADPSNYNYKILIAKLYYESNKEILGREWAMKAKFSILTDLGIDGLKKSFAGFNDLVLFRDLVTTMKENNDKELENYVKRGLSMSKTNDDVLFFKEFSFGAGCTATIEGDEIIPLEEAVGPSELTMKIGAIINNVINKFNNGAVVASISLMDDLVESL